MPSFQKIVLALAFVASTFAAQISDGQIQQPSSVPAVVKQITDGQLQQVTSTTTPSAVVTPAVKQITDGQLQQVSASIKPSVSANATSVTTPSAPATFKGAASLMSYSTELVAVAIGAAAVFAML